MKKGMNKRGFEMVMSTIVIIILALILLIVILFFFMNSSGTFAETIKSYFSYSNVDNSVQSCNILVQSGNTYSFCCEKKMIKYYQNGSKGQKEFSCDELSNEGFISGKINKLDCGGITC